MNPLPVDLRETASRIKLLVLDVDGVLTDGTLSYSESGEHVKNFNAKDGLGIRLAMNNGIDIAIITARNSPILKKRMTDLDIVHFYGGQHDKADALDQIMGNLNLSTEQVAYVGDDILDLPVMRMVGLPITVSDGHELVKDVAAWTTSLPGGRGAVREVTDGLIACRGDLLEAVNEFLDKTV